MPESTHKDTTPQSGQYWEIGYSFYEDRSPITYKEIVQGTKDQAKAYLKTIIEQLEPWVQDDAEKTQFTEPVQIKHLQ